MRIEYFGKRSTHPHFTSVIYFNFRLLPLCQETSFERDGYDDWGSATLEDFNQVQHSDSDLWGTQAMVFGSSANDLREFGKIASFIELDSTGLTRLRSPMDLF